MEALKEKGVTFGITEESHGPYCKAAAHIALDMYIAKEINIPCVIIHITVNFHYSLYLKAPIIKFHMPSICFQQQREKKRFRGRMDTL